MSRNMPSQWTSPLAAPPRLDLHRYLAYSSNVFRRISSTNEQANVGFGLPSASNMMCQGFALAQHSQPLSKNEPSHVDEVSPPSSKSQHPYAFHDEGGGDHQQCETNWLQSPDYTADTKQLHPSASSGSINTEAYQALNHLLQTPKIGSQPFGSEQPSSTTAPANNFSPLVDGQLSSVPAPPANGVPPTALPSSSDGTESILPASAGQANNASLPPSIKPCRIQGCNEYAEFGVRRLYCLKHSGNRRCEYTDCTKRAQGATSFCIAHGGGRRCTFPGCKKAARGKLFCVAHGGGKRCMAKGCSKSGIGGSNFCTRHGGGRRCAVDGCDKSARSMTKFCVKHGGGKKCTHNGCEKVARGRTMFCVAHGGGVRCKLHFCSRMSVGKEQLCRAHASSIVHSRPPPPASAKVYDDKAMPATTYCSFVEDFSPSQQASQLKFNPSSLDLSAPPI